MKEQNREGDHLISIDLKKNDQVSIHDFFSKKDNKIIPNNYTLPKWIARKTTFSPSKNPFYIYNDTLCFEQIYNGDVFTVSPKDYKLNPRYF